MTRNLITFALLCLLVVIAPSLVRAADRQCAIATQDEFLAAAKPRIVKVFTVSKAKREKYIANINAKRKAANVFALEADTMVLGELKSGKIGIAMFKDGCLVPGTESVNARAGLRVWLKEMNSEDILTEMEAAP